MAEVSLCVALPRGYCDLDFWLLPKRVKYFSLMYISSRKLPSSEENKAFSVD